MNPDEAIRALRDTIFEEFPQLAEVFNAARDKNQTEHVAMEGVLHVIEKHPEMAERLRELAMEIMEPLRKEGELLKPKTPEGPGILFDSGVGLLRMNPLYEAALIERAQFDGDMPELRHGQLDRETLPSVPVETEARSPAAIGAMMERAAYEVQGEVEESRQRLIEEAEAKGKDLIPKDDPTDLAAIARGSAETDPEGYKRGQLPALRKVEVPSGSELAEVPAPVRQERAWKFLSTSHGRRSVEQTIRDALRERLGDVVELADRPQPVAPKKVVPVLAYAEWKYPLSGSRSVQSEYALVDTAVVVLAKKLRDQVEEEGIEGEVNLEVHAINTVDIRSVGWAARLVE